jgi:uncharacterized protein DUF5335
MATRDMTTREIPPESWKEFFDGFSRRHQGWLVDVEVLGTLGAQYQAEQLPLQGISADHANKDISISLALPTNKIVEHFVNNPAKVRVEEEGGAEGAIQIESSDGVTTLVSFRSAVPPEMVDGLLPGQAR